MGHEIDEESRVEDTEAAATPGHSTVSQGELLSRIRNCPESHIRVQFQLGISVRIQSLGGLFSTKHLTPKETMFQEFHGLRKVLSISLCNDPVSLSTP